jgi:glycosyltransferase involved in cell wall biosynthesis
MRLVINAAFLAPGGGPAVLTGLLGGWRDLGADLDVTVFVRRRAVIELLQRAGWGALVRPVPASGTAQTVWWQSTRLPRALRELRPDIFMNINIHVAGAPCPEIVHHQNLWTLFSRSLWPYWRHGPKAWLNALGARRAAAQASANVYISGYLRGCAEAIDPTSADRNHVIHNGVPADFLLEPPPEAARSELQLCAVQAPLEHKDNESLLQALAALVGAMPALDWRLDVAGQGPWDRWRGRAAELGLAERVRFLGHLEPAALKQLYERAVCLVYPSVFEGFGLPVIEAMARGCPVVAAEAGAIPEVAGDAALLVPPRSPLALRDAVRRLHEDARLRGELIERGRRRAGTFTWSASAGRFLELFERVRRGA